MIDDPQFFFYRKSMLEEAGVEPPQTLDELIEAAARLTTSKVKGLFLGNDLHAVINPLIWSAGADTLNEKNEIAYHTDGVVEGLRKMRKLFTSGDLLLDAPRRLLGPLGAQSGPVRDPVLRDVGHAAVPADPRRRPRHHAVPEGR